MRFLLALLVLLAVATQYVSATSRISALDLLERRVAAEQTARDDHFASLAETNARLQARVHATVEAEAGVTAQAEAQAQAEAAAQVQAEAVAQAEVQAAAEAQLEEEAENEAVEEVTQEQEVEDLAARHMLQRLQQQVIEQAHAELRRRETQQAVNLMETDSTPTPTQHMVHQSTIASKLEKVTIEKAHSMHAQMQHMHTNMRSLLQMKKQQLQQHKQQQQQFAGKPHRVRNEVVLDGMPAQPHPAVVQKEMNKVVDQVMQQDVTPQMTIRQKILDDARRVNALAEHTHKDYKNWQEDVKEMKLLPNKNELI